MTGAELLALHEKAKKAEAAWVATIRRWKAGQDDHFEPTPGRPRAMVAYTETRDAMVEALKAFLGPVAVRTESAGWIYFTLLIGLDGPHGYAAVPARDATLLHAGPEPAPVPPPCDKLVEVLPGLHVERGTVVRHAATAEGTSVRLHDGEAWRYDHATKTLHLTHAARF